MGTVDLIVPDHGPASGGTIVEIVGDGFLEATAVGFGVTAATDVSFVSDTMLRATSPAGSGSEQVVVVFADGSEALSPTPFMFDDVVAQFGDVVISSSGQVAGATGAIHTISSDSSMPDLTVVAPLLGVPDDAIVARRFRLEVVYDDGHRRDATHVPALGMWDVVVGPYWQPDFGGWSSGGELNVFVEFDQDPTTTVTWETELGAHTIWGLNPTKADVRARAGDQINLSVVFHRESRFTQFKTGTGIANAFVAGPHPPLRGVDPGGTVGYGIGQLTTTPVPTIEELWSWVANVDSAVSKLLGLRQNAVTYQEQVQQGLPWTGETGGDPPHEGTAYPDAPDFTDDQLDLEMYARYNGRFRYHNYDPITGTWVRRIPVGGQDATTSLPYADQVEMVKHAVLAGNDPAGWAERRVVVPSVFPAGEAEDGS
jgi:hypothetical protein